MQILGHGLEALGDLGDLLHAVGLAMRAGATQQLQIVDHEEIQTLGALQAARARAQGGDRERGRVVDEQRQGSQLLARAHDEGPVLLADVAAPQSVGFDPALPGEQPRGQLLGRHLEREHADDVVGVTRLARVRGHVPRRGGVRRDGDGQGRLAHARAAGEDEQVGWLQAAQLLVELPRAWSARPRPCRSCAKRSRCA